MESPIKRQTAPNSPLTNIRIPLSDYKSNIKFLTHQRWKQIWTETYNNKLRENQNIRNLTITSTHCPGKTQSLSAAYTHQLYSPTHRHLMCREEAPLCLFIQTLTIKHLLTTCTQHESDVKLFKLQGNTKKILDIGNDTNIIKINQIKFNYKTIFNVMLYVKFVHYLPGRRSIKMAD